VLITLNYGATTVNLYTSGGFVSVDELSIEFDFEETITITATQDIDLQMEIVNSTGGTTITTTYEQVDVTLAGVTETLTGFSATAYPIYEAFLRICQIISDSNDVFYSSYFGRTDTPVVTYGSDGQLGHLAKGAFLRNATGLNNTFPLSFASLFDSISKIFNVGMGIFEFSGVEKVKIEALRDFFDDNVILDLSSRIRSAAIAKEVLPDWHYGRILSGYEQFTYEAVGGLSEFNTKSEWSTPLSHDQELNLTAKLRADTNGIIKLWKERTSTEDVEGDDSTFLIDSVRDGGDFLARTDEGFDTITGGIAGQKYYNLDLTPARNMRRHDNEIRAGLEHELNEYIRWQSSGKNTLLATDKPLEDEVVENADIQINDMADPFYWPEAYIVECEFKHSDLTTLLTSPYSLIKIGTNKYGWLLELRLGNHENKAEMKLLRANLTYVTPIEA
jgi:hypothetical protein